MISGLLLALSCLPQGSTVYVPDDYPFIQTALTAMDSGDTIIVRPGTYYEYDLNFLGKNLTLRSELGPGLTIIDGTAASSVFEFGSGEGPDAILDGFTITNGMKWDGGGVSIIADPNGFISSPTIQNCIIENNVGSGGGGGMHIRGGSLTLVDNCLIQNNTTTFYHGAGVVIFGSSPIFRNCTIRNNVATGTGGAFGIWDSASDVTIRNSILYGNSPSNIDLYNGAATVRVRYSLSEGDSSQSWFGTGCIDGDPLFASGPRGDSYLSQIASGQLADSPCLDLGKPSTPAFGITRTDHVQDQGIVDLGFHYLNYYEILLSSTGAPGGTMTFDVSEATPFGLLIYFYSFALGSYSGTNPFTGNVVTTGLGALRFNMAALVGANGLGDYSLSSTVPAGAAGNVHVQVLDGMSDKFSRVLDL